MLDDRVVDSIFAVLGTSPFFLPHRRKVAVVSAMSVNEWHHSTETWTVSHAFESSPCPEEALRDCEIIFYPHCTRGHWTLYVGLVTLQMFFFFDPMHCSDEYFVEHRWPVFADLRIFLSRVAQRDIAERPQGCASASDWLSGIASWPLRDATEWAPALPRQYRGLGCALHIIAFAMDVLSGTHEVFSDHQALIMRRWLKFVLATGTAERVRLRSV